MIGQVHCACAVAHTVVASLLFPPVSLSISARNMCEHDVITLITGLHPVNVDDLSLTVLQRSAFAMISQSNHMILRCLLTLRIVIPWISHAPRMP